MPRTKLGADTYARSDFLRHMAAQQAYYGLKTQAELGKAIGLCQSSTGQCLRYPDKIRIGVMRKMIRALHLNPEVVLLFLGYTLKDIKNLKTAQNTQQEYSTNQSNVTAL